MVRGGGGEGGTGRLELVSLRASLQAQAGGCGAHTNRAKHVVVCLVGSPSIVLGLQLTAAGAVRSSSCLAGHVAVRSAGLAAPHDRCCFLQ